MTKFKLPKKFSEFYDKIDAQKQITADDYLALIKLALGLGKEHPETREGMSHGLWLIYSNRIDNDKPFPQIYNSVDNLYMNYDIHDGAGAEGWWKDLEDEVKKYENSIKK